MSPPAHVRAGPLLGTTGWMWLPTRSLTLPPGQGLLREKEGSFLPQAPTGSTAGPFHMAGKCLPRAATHLRYLVSFTPLTTGGNVRYSVPSPFVGGESGVQRGPVPSPLSPIREVVGVSTLPRTFKQCLPTYPE